MKLDLRFTQIGKRVTPKRRALLLACIAALVGLALMRNPLPAGQQNWAGEVGDSKCGKLHTAGTHADCTRACLSQGEKYVLVVGDTIFTLETSDRKFLSALDQQVGNYVILRGKVTGHTIEVSSVIPYRGRTNWPF
jgi:hypothetical protein